MYFRTGTVFVFLSNKQTSQGIADVSSATSSSFTDAINFVNDTVNVCTSIKIIITVDFSVGC